MSDSSLAPGSQAYAGGPSAFRGKEKLDGAVRKHASKVVYGIAILVVGILYYAKRAAKFHAKYMACANPKSGFGVTNNSNLKGFGLQSHWNAGAQSAAGPFENVGYVPDSTPNAYQAVIAKHLRPGMRRAMMKRAARLGGRKGTREGMYPQPCKPGDHAWVGADGQAVCLSDGEMAAAAAASGAAIVDDDTEGGAFVTGCGGSWDPAAVADTQALAALGAIESTADGEQRLQDIVDGEPGAHLNDTQLTAMLYAGAP